MSFPLSRGVGDFLLDMTGCLASLRVLALAGCLSGVGGLGVPAAAAQEHAPSSAGADIPAPDAATPPLAFDIPAQPLADALRQYALLTRQPALFRSEIVAGRVSSPVHGPYPPGEALQRLLEGTGLIAETVEGSTGKAFVLKAAGAAPAGGGAGLGNLTGYPGLVQTGVWEALCSNPRTAPGTYRSLLRFRVDAGGALRAVQLLGPSGDARRDAAIVAALQRVQLGAPPPADLPQPVIMLILPRAARGPDAGPRCAPASGAQPP
ncbi:hypothetical protein [Cupriavidus sp. USMAA2-4]|uniref:hypothetical protein n=1 Tax=Cupriavidus sp. USMAA2-4 TaxID=876364 RepID=UPI0012F49675|nr:hypothetical protein [Cupriavidus sp. USMAA2-4]